MMMIQFHKKQQKQNNMAITKVTQEDTMDRMNDPDNTTIVIPE